MMGGGGGIYGRVNGGLILSQHNLLMQSYYQRLGGVRAYSEQRFGRLWLYGIMTCGLQVVVNVICLFGRGREHRAYLMLEWSPVVILVASLVLALLACHVVGKGRCLWRSVIFALSATYRLFPLHILLMMRGGDISYFGDNPSAYLCAAALHFGVAPCALAVILWIKSEAPGDTRESGCPVFSLLWACCLAALALEVAIYAAWQGYHEPLRTWLILSQPINWALIPASLLVLSTWLTALALWLLGERYSLWRGVFFVALLSYGLLPFYLLQYLVTGDFSPTVFYKLPLCFGLVPLWLTIIYYARLCKRFNCK